MNKTLLIMRYEMVSQLTRKAYLVFTFGVPLVAFIVLTAVRLINENATEAITSAITSETTEVAEIPPMGFVDHSGIIQMMPDDTTSLTAYDNETAALTAVTNNIIDGYFIIPQDYITTGEIVYIDPEAVIEGIDEHEWVIQWVLTVNLMDGDEEQAAFLWNPANVEETAVTLAGQEITGTDTECLTPGYDCDSNALVRYLPLIMVALFYIFINTSAGTLMGSVSNEKKNRTIEVVLSSVTPRQMLTGKIIGLGITSFLQVLTWIGGGSLLLRLGGQTLQLPDGFEWPISILAWSIVYFVLGYAVYASLMAGAGALVPDVKEAGQVSWIINMPLFIAYLLGLFLIQAPEEPIAVGLSFFPLTAPIVMIMRLTMGGVPFWQLVLSAGLMLVTAVVVVRAVSNMFRANILLSGQPFNIKRYATALLGKS